MMGKQLPDIATNGIGHVPLSGRGSRRHYTVQFSDDGAVLDVPACYRLREYVCIEAVRADTNACKPLSRAVS